MSCPHSNQPDASPDRCSQCLGAAARIVRFRSEQTRVQIDDEEFAFDNTDVMIDEDVAPVPVKIERHTRRFREKSEIRCGVCGQLGHQRNECKGEDDAPTS